MLRRAASDEHASVNCFGESDKKKETRKAAEATNPKLKHRQQFSKFHLHRKPFRHDPAECWNVEEIIIEMDQNNSICFGLKVRFEVLHVRTSRAILKACRAP